MTRPLRHHDPEPRERRCLRCGGRVVRLDGEVRLCNQCVAELKAALEAEEGAAP